MRYALAVIAVIATPALALAQVPEQDVFAIVKALVVAVTSGQWPVVLALSLVVAVYVVRRVAVAVPRLGAFFATTAGGTLLAIATAFSAGLGGAVLAGQAVTWHLVSVVAVGAFTAIGGWNAVRRLLPLLTMLPYVGRVFGWLVPSGDLHARVVAETREVFKPVPVDAAKADAALVAPVEKP